MAAGRLRWRRSTWVALVMVLDAPEEEMDLVVLATTELGRGSGDGGRFRKRWRVSEELVALHGGTSHQRG